MNNQLIQNFGFCEMYEFSSPETTERQYGKFVQFDPKNPGKIIFCTNPEEVLGVTSINSVIDSDDPDYWQPSFSRNEFGDAYMHKETLSIGKKEYDQENEMPYMVTAPYINFSPIFSKEYDKEKKYIKRSNRKEWIRVNLLGKCIVEDNGKCVPGKYCTIYKGRDKKRVGTAIPATTKSTVKYYVLKRISDNAILILNTRNI